MPSNTVLALAGALMLCAHRQADAHGAMLLPPPRNAIDSTIPGADWGNGTNTTGHLEPLHVNCANGTDACSPGQSVFWFSQGCTPGCPECDGQGQRIPFWDHCNATRAQPFKSTLAKQYWSANRNATEGGPHDIWQYQPWVRDMLFVRGVRTRTLVHAFHTEIDCKNSRAAHPTV